MQSTDPIIAIIEVTHEHVDIIRRVPLALIILRDAKGHNIDSRPARAPSIIHEAQSRVASLHDGVSSTELVELLRSHRLLIDLPFLGR